MKLLFSSAILIVMMFHVTLVWGQKTKVIKEKNKYELTTYEVLSSNKEIKNGFYIKKTKGGRLIVKGEYKDNKKSGLWSYYTFNNSILSAKGE